MFYITAFFINWLLGIALLEWTLKRMERTINFVEERDSQFPAFRRLDVKTLTRANLYPGTMLLFLRLITIVPVFIIMVIVMNLCYIGVSTGYAEPLSGMRRLIFNFFIKNLNLLLLYLFGYSPKHAYKTESEVDYSKYLGPNYRNEKFKGNRVSTVISNHIGFLDILMYGTCEDGRYCAYTPAEFIAEVWLGLISTRVVQCIYMNRDSAKDGRDKTVEEIIQRQELIENSEADWPWQLIFAEGSVTNGKNLSRFRRGGFSGLKAIQPCIVKYDWKNVNPTYAEGMGLEIGLLIVSELGMKSMTCTHYPTFIPNDYLFTEYAKTIEGHEKLEKWEIYAHAV